MQRELEGSGPVLSIDLLPFDIHVILIDSTSIQDKKLLNNTIYICLNIWMHVNKTWKKHVDHYLELRYSKNEPMILAYAYLFNKYAHNIRAHVSCPHRHITNTSITKCTSLTSLWLYATHERTNRINDQGLVFMTQLQSLGLHGPIINITYRSLDRLTNLTQLTLSKSNVTNDDIRRLVNLKSLTLNLAVMIDLSEGLPSLTNLRELKLTNYPNNGVINLPQLESLIIGDSYDRGHDLRYLINLQHLDIIQCHLKTQRTLDSLPKLTQLRVHPINYDHFKGIVHPLISVTTQ